MKVMTMLWPGGVRFVMGGWQGVVATLMVSRRGSVRTALFREGRPNRTKHWTPKRDHRRRMVRVEAYRRQHPTTSERTR